MVRPVLDNPWVRAVGALAVLVLAAMFVNVLSAVLVPLFFAFLVAYVLNPVVDFFQRRRIPRTVTISVLAVAAIALLVVVPLFLIPNILAEADRLRVALTESASSGTVASWLEKAVAWLPLDEVVRELGWAPRNAQYVDAVSVISERIDLYINQQMEQILNAFLADFATAGQKVTYTAAQIFTTLSRSTYGVLLFLGNFMLFSFVTGYLLKDFHTLVAGARDLVPPKHLAYVSEIVGKIDLQIRGFLRGQLLVCLCLGAMYAIGLVLLGVPFAILVALFAGLASFVPYMGVVVGIGPALGLSLIEDGVGWNLLGVVLTFWVAQAIEGSFLTPTIVGDRVGLNPVWVILAIMVFGTTLGFLGILVAVPAAAVLKVIVLEGVRYYKASSLFETGASESAEEPPGT